MLPIAPHFIPRPLPSSVLSDSFGDEVCHFEKTILSQISYLKKKFKKNSKN
jgi:hypothetical protein